MTERPTRGSDGRFLPGNPGGPGRPRRAVEADYLRALAEACPLETWREICEQAVMRAKAGDHRALDWLAKYLLGEARLRDSLSAEERQRLTFEAIA